MNLENMRKEYENVPIRRSSLLTCPFAQFLSWLETAVQRGEIDPNAMVLSTASKEGAPSSRNVLLKHCDTNGFTFYTNYHSLKAKNIEGNPLASLAFYWRTTEKQVVIQGTVRKVSRQETEDYFSKRSRESQIGAWASRQDTAIPSRGVIEQAYEEYKKQFEGKKIPVPPYWGGFKIAPNRFDFWQGGKDRLSDRFEYFLKNDIWEITRLSP